VRYTLKAILWMHGPTVVLNVDSHISMWTIVEAVSW